ncbi:MAG: hemolysin family protein [Mycobacteriales bacterium]
MGHLVGDPALIAVAALLVVTAGCCAMADAALARVSPARVAQLVTDRASGAKALGAVLRSLPAHVSLLLLLRLACELTATLLVAWVAIDGWGLSLLPLAVTAAAMTVVSFVLVGVGPRTVGRQHPYPVALALAGVIRRLGYVLGPLARLLIVVGNAVTPGKGYREGPFATELELRELLDLAELRGDVEHDERDMIHSVFELGDTMVREVMVPRTDVVWIEADKTASQALTLALRSGFSRIPVIGVDVDDVVGVVYLKDAALALHDHSATDSATGKALVNTVMRPAEFIPEFKPIDDLLREMQARRIHIAIVVDEYGGTAGLVTIEDIVEEIVGEIADEYDNERAQVQQLGSGAVRVIARLPVDDLAELFGVRLPMDEAETVGGLLAHALGKVPIPGASAEVAGLRLTAESAGGRRNRVDTVVVSRRRAADGQGHSTEGVITARNVSSAEN